VKWNLYSNVVSIFKLVLSKPFPQINFSVGSFTSLFSIVDAQQTDPCSLFTFIRVSHTSADVEMATMRNGAMIVGMNFSRQ
jgi:hypothetical protein